MLVSVRKEDPKVIFPGSDSKLYLLKVSLLKLEEDIFIAGITYDDQDPDDEEPDFAPKHGYWGPYIY